MRRFPACPWTGVQLPFAAVAGALVAAPFAMASTGAFMTQVGRCNRTDPDRRRHVVPRHGGREVPAGKPHEGAAHRSASRVVTLAAVAALREDVDRPSDDEADDHE